MNIVAKVKMIREILLHESLGRGRLDVRLDCCSFCCELNGDEILGRRDV